MSASTTPYKRAKASSPPETTLGSLSFRENGADEEREREREREREMMMMMMMMKREERGMELREKKRNE